MALSFSALIGALLLVCSSVHGTPVAHSHLPLCERGQDANGIWRSVSDFAQNKTDLKQHFVLGGPGQGVNFKHIWLPDGCAIHRFTNQTISAFAAHILEETHAVGPLHIIMLGDSTTRGVFCGITRLLAGGPNCEMVGPNENKVCGSGTEKCVDYLSTNVILPVDFSPQLRMSFAFIQTLSNASTAAVLEEAVRSNPYALVFNTGAWEFGAHARQHQDHLTKMGDCEDPDTKAISLQRASPQAKAVMRAVGSYAIANNVRVIFRNSHINDRYGAHCADDRFEQMLEGSGWEVWDNNRNISRYMQSQLWDGLHYDRAFEHTVAEHDKTVRMGFGYLEMALTHSLLWTLFHDTVEHFVTQKHHQQEHEQMEMDGAEK